MLKALLSTPETAKEHFEIDIAFHGYDDDARELSRLLAQDQEPVSL